RNDTGRPGLLTSRYDKRRATLRDATSRNYNMRELEIEAIASQLSDSGPVLDLGCGNGYTLLSLATRLEGWEMLGIDFSDNLVDGALALRDEMRAELLTLPEFLLADATNYVR